MPRLDALTRIPGPMVARLAALAWHGAACAPATSGWQRADSLRVDSMLEARAAAHELMGAVVLMRDGKVVYARGVGWADVAQRRPFTPYTASDGASLAKTLTAAAVWRLAQEGRLVLDTTVTTYLPEYPYRGTLVRHLIEHTNGLPPYYEMFDPYFRPGHVRQTTDLLAIVQREMPIPRFPPGTRFEYSNIGFDAAALIVERVVGKPIAEVFDTWFFAPLQMDSAFVRPGRFADFPGPRTRGYRWEDSTWARYDVNDNEGFVGGSNVYFSAMEIARWASAFAQGRSTDVGVTMSGLKAPLIDGRPSAITGLSWYCDDAKRRCHYGGVYNAFFSLAYWDQVRREAVAVVTNSSIPPWSWISLQRELIATLAGRSLASTSSVQPQIIPEDSIKLLAGQYLQRTGDRELVPLTLRWENERLGIQLGTGLTYEVFHVAPDAFYVPGLDWMVGFARAEGREWQMRVSAILTEFDAVRVGD